MNAWLADVVLAMHFAFVVFIVAGLPLVWLGAIARWQWIRHRGFRIAHLAAILFVAFESLLGVLCPLTVWEDALRGMPERRTFIARWLHRLMYYDLPDRVFVIAYAVFAVAVALTYVAIPPRRKRGPQ